MKKLVLLVILGMVAVCGYCQPRVTNLVYPNSVDLFDLCELSFQLNKSYDNPYDPDVISVIAEFIAPDGSRYAVNGFYYEGYTFKKQKVYEVASPNVKDVGWRVRFTPTQIGIWTFRLTVTDRSGSVQMPASGTRTLSFSCNKIGNGKGFISMANKRFLKRDVVEDGMRRFHSFFPIGPNIAWYGYAYHKGVPCYSEPFGIYEYDRYIDSLDGNANYMRIWISRYQYLSLYGLEFALPGKAHAPVVFFDHTINQKDAAELDHIVAYAKRHDVTIMPCFFHFGDFEKNTSKDVNNPSVWSNNPYHTILGLESPCEFFTDEKAIHITKNLIRYIVSRWGYATNIMAWEFWNEVSNLFDMCDDNELIYQEVRDWHNEMAAYVSEIDPFNHCLTTSMGGIKEHPDLFSILFDDMDFVQQHNYQNIQKAKSTEQFSYLLYKSAIDVHKEYPSKPFFTGEFGFGQTSPAPQYADKDPYGIDLHNSLWSSLFSSSMGPAAFWWWTYIDSKGLFKLYAPILHFCERLPILSESFTAHQTGKEVGKKRLEFPNHIQTYYMINATEDTIYGWSQDTAFAYQSLRRLTDKVAARSEGTKKAGHFVNDGVFDSRGYVYNIHNTSKKPRPSSNNNTILIPVEHVDVGSSYVLKWYNTETGYAYDTSKVHVTHVTSDVFGNKYISISFPSYIRDVQRNVIQNTFGDVAFSLIRVSTPVYKISVKN